MKRQGEARASVSKILEHVEGSYGADDTENLRSVIERGVGEEHYSESLERAWLCTQLQLNPAGIAAAFLLGEGRLGSKLDDDDFRTEAQKLLEGVKRLASVDWHALEEESTESLRRMFVALAADVRVVLIALADRLLKLRAFKTIEDAEKRKRLAVETSEVFAPLANRLGIWQLKWELEDLSLRILEPETYHEISRLLDESRKSRSNYIEETITTIRAEIEKQKITPPLKISGRPKHIYSIYKKMQRKQVGFDQVYDVTAVRLIVDSIGDCYSLLGLIHSLWVPIPGEFDDYIARPKENMYQSLHTAVVGPSGKSVEIQIRTREMHEYAEYGVAAHWAYKEGKKGGGPIVNSTFCDS